MPGPIGQLRRLRSSAALGLPLIGGPRIVLAGGMNRSGSTWLYNAARLMLARQAGAADQVSAGWVDDWPTLPRAPTMLVKLHEYDARFVDVASIVLYSYRDIRDVLASAQRAWGVAPTLESATHHIEQHRHWIAVADLVMRYETMLGDRRAALTRLASVLGAQSVDVDAIDAQLDAMEFKPEDSAAHHDPVTLLHKGHRTDGRHGSWAGVLSDQLVQEIAERHGAWLAENGYALDRSVACD